MLKPPTEKEIKVYEFLEEFFRENDQLPTAQAIAVRFKCWPNAAVDFLHSLERKGAIERNSIGRYRFSRSNGQV